MVIEKAEGGTYGECVQPQSHLGQLNGHRILVNAVDAAFEHHSPNDVAVVELIFVYSPAPSFSVAQDRVADSLDAFSERRNVIAPSHLRFGLGHRVNNVIGYLVHHTNEEVARS